MIVRKFRPDIDYEWFKEWMEARGLPVPPLSQLPSCGWIVDGYAVCFLVKTDAKVGVVEYLVTNPQPSTEFKMLATDLIIEQIEREAKKAGCEVMIGYTTLPNVVARGFRYGFKTDAKPYYMFRKNLTEEKKPHGRRSERSSSSSRAERPAT